MNEILMRALRRRFFNPAEGFVWDSPEDVVHRVGDSVSALLYGSLFVPDFVEVDGSILVEFGAADRKRKFVDAKKNGTMSLPALEASFNFFEVPYLFSQRHLSDDAEDALLATMIAEAWRGRLALLFPNRKFIVSTISPKDSGSVIGVEFFESR